MYINLVLLSRDTHWCPLTILCLENHKHHPHGKHSIPSSIWTPSPTIQISSQSPCHPSLFIVMTISAFSFSYLPTWYSNPCPCFPSCFSHLDLPRQGLCQVPTLLFMFVITVWLTQWLLVPGHDDLKPLVTFYIFFKYILFTHFIIPFGKFWSPNLGKLQQPQEQCYPVLWILVSMFHCVWWHTFSFCITTGEKKKPFLNIWMTFSLIG